MEVAHLRPGGYSCKFTTGVCSRPVPDKVRWVCTHFQSIIVKTDIPSDEKKNVCNSFYTMWWMPHTMWLVVAYDLLECRHLIDIIANLSSLCGLTWHMVLKKMWLSKWMSEKKFNKSCVQVRKTRETKTKMSSWLLEEAESGINLHSSCHHVSLVCETHSSENVSAMILLWQSVKKVIFTACHSGKLRLAYTWG